MVLDRKDIMNGFDCNKGDLSDSLLQAKKWAAKSVMYLNDDIS